ncbi:MAG TPA: protoporphyrinogen oxidase [Jatrophihabitantaceae bacterium]|nr:protoporphyrinogen oxidase [Jatrophihabitantaceae bacterium]
MTVAVIGGGISGLAAAWTLSGHGHDVVVLEAAPVIGGKLRVAPVAGVPVDVGAEAMLARRPEGLELVEALGLRTIEPLTTAAALRAGGALHRLPARTMLGIPSDVAAVRESGALTEHALARIAAEPDQPPMPPVTADLSVGSLVRSRLGNEVADRLVEPLLGGVYAGRADRLSVQATMPALYAALGPGGSLVEAAAQVVSRPSASGPVFASLPGGLGSLPVALAASARFEVRTAVTVRSIRRDGAGFVLSCGAAPMPYDLRADAVIVATPAAKTARLLADVAPVAAAELAEVESASMAIVTFAFRDIALPAGSGLLVGLGEGLSVKGVTISSQKWPLESGGLTLLRASVGRIGEAQVLHRRDDDLIALARHDLSTLLGITAAPEDAIVTRWGGGLPQYGVGHVPRIARVRAAVAEVPGLAVCGAAFDGLGIPACIASAGLAASRLGE